MVQMFTGVKIIVRSGMDAEGGGNAALNGRDAYGSENTVWSGTESV